MKLIVNATGYVGQANGAGGAGVFLQYLIDQLAEIFDVDVLVGPNSSNFLSRKCTARFIELPYLTAEILSHLRAGPTVVLDPFGGLPCSPFPDDMALCVVVHDLMHLDCPHFFNPSERADRSGFFARGLERADAIITFSIDQARAVQHYFPHTEPVVIPHLPYMCLSGAPGNPVPVADLGQFVLLPAVKWPHKNHKTVIEAFGSYVKRTGSALKLVLCGGPCAESRFSFFPAGYAMPDCIVDLGRVDNQTMRFLYSAASAVLFPTLYEGFGIPVLESAYQGKMIVASKLAVFDEILGAGHYRSVLDPLCHLRWIEALAEVERPSRDLYEARALVVRQRTAPRQFVDKLAGLMGTIAERYTHPALYPASGFPIGDRAASSILARLTFSDVYESTTVDRGSRQTALGARGTTQSSAVYRSAGAMSDRRKCLRATYDAASLIHGLVGNVQFYAWVRLLSDVNFDELNWSVDDSRVVNLLPTMRDGDWHLIRYDIPATGHIDFRASRAGQSEVADFDLEIHDPSILFVKKLMPPIERPLARSLTVFVTGLTDDASLTSVGADIIRLNAILPGAIAAVSWVFITRLDAWDDGTTADDLPPNFRVHFVQHSQISRDDVTGLITPYQPIDRMLLLEATDLADCLEGGNLEILATALSLVPSRNEWCLNLRHRPGGFWRQSEIGRIIDVAHRIGEPVPLLDPFVIDNIVQTTQTKRRPRFAVIETDRTNIISHHGMVTQLFLTGAETLGFQPILGLHRSATGARAGGIDVWTGFSQQVYSAGTADGFSEELERFVTGNELGPDDIIFMHSLAPQILLGAARFIASAPSSSPRFAMRFFSTAEAMQGHGLSYVKILRSIESVRVVREKMHFFCESLNLAEYYARQVGRHYPVLFNPEHPSLSIVRDSKWFDPNLGGGRPVLAYFGEAREEKGFDDLPGIVNSLLRSEAIKEFQFLIQIGSNSGNATEKIVRAKASILTLKAMYPGRVQTFESIDTSEQFYFMMKHARGVIAPYRPESYGIRGSGVTLEALQMGLDVFVWEQTDLYATFRDTACVIGVTQGMSFADTIIQYYSSGVIRQPNLEALQELRQSPKQVCESLLSKCVAEADSGAMSSSELILWVGNDVFGEGCSAVYGSQKQAMHQLGRDCFELFVPWPDQNWAGVDPGAYDAKIYGFDSYYGARGLAWICKPIFTPELGALLNKAEGKGRTYSCLRDVSKHFTFPESLKRALTANQVRHTVLNYAHLYPVIEGLVSVDEIICETHDIQAYQNATRRGDRVVLEEKLDELSDLSRFASIIAISAPEQREISSACVKSDVHWRLPPYIPENAPESQASESRLLQADTLYAWEGIPDDVSQPSRLMVGEFYARPDLQSVFRLDTLEGRMLFFRWWSLCGHLEVPDAVGFTPRQYEWLTANPTNRNGKGKGLDGLSRLVLSMREDVSQAVSKKGGVNVKAVDAWMYEHMESEFGFKKELLLQGYSHHHSAAAASQPVVASCSVLNAVLDASPICNNRETSAFRKLFERISDVQQVDLVLVGSGHPSNVQSFRWFFSEVFLKYFASKARNLFLIGSVCDQLQDLTHHNLFVLGRCARIGPMLQASRACPLPVIGGSGSPIKTIPAMALNGAVTITDHVGDAFGLREYGIPAFSDPRDFAEDLWLLLVDQPYRDERRACAARYVQENLTLDGYVKFWAGLLDPSESSRHARAG